MKKATKKFYNIDNISYFVKMPYTTRNITAVDLIIYMFMITFVKENKEYNNILEDLEKSKQLALDIYNEINKTSLK